MYNKSQLESLTENIINQPDSNQEVITKQIDQLVDLVAKLNAASQNGQVNQLTGGKDFSLPLNLKLRFTSLKKDTIKNSLQDINVFRRLPGFEKISPKLLDELAELDPVISEWLQKEPVNIARFTAAPVETFIKLADQQVIRLSKELRDYLTINYNSFRQKRAVMPGISFKSTTSYFQK